ncbi:unnamed protein product [Alternaria alternata]
MFFKSKLLLSFVSLASVIAAPTKQPRLEDLQCRCLTFSTSAAPTLCSYQELLTLDWDTAYSLATVNDLKIQFASKKAMTKVLALPKPVPTSILLSVHEGQVRPLDPAKKVQNENRIVCGFGDEVEHVGDHEKSLEVEVHYVGTVLGLFMLLLIIYLVGDYLWTRYISRVGSIKLEGDEKTLTAEFETSTNNLSIDYP